MSQPISAAISAKSRPPAAGMALDQVTITRAAVTMESAFNTVDDAA